MSESGSFLKLCTLFGFSTTLDREWLKFLNLYPIVVFLSLNCWTLVSFYLYLSHYERNRSKVIIFILNITKVVSYVFLINYFFAFARRREKWRGFLRDLSHVRRDLLRDGRLDFPIKKSFTAHAFLTVASGYVRYTMLITRDYPLYWNPSALTNVMLIVMRFYILLSVFLIESTTLAFVSCCAALRVRVLRGDSRAVARCDDALYYLRKRSEEIFGWQTYLNMQVIALRILGAVVTVTEMYEEDGLEKVHAIACNLAFCALDVVLTLKIILPADELRRAGRSLRTSCRRIALSRRTDARLKPEFLSLSETLRVPSLGMSAAGFYDVDRGVLLGMASVLTTYFIVYLQFR